VPPPADLLDAGAGGGLRTLAARRLGYRATALEPDPLEAAAARALLGDGGVIEAPLESAPGAPADAVLAWHVLEHVSDLDVVVAAIRDRLRPGGAVVAAVPNPEGVEARLLGDRWHGWEPARHRWHLGARALAAVLAAGGLTGVRVAARGGWRYPASLAFSVAPGLDPQVHPDRAAAGRAAAIAAVPPALAARALGLGPQLVAVARTPGPA
jgi:SAM-dependent methyltransferase